jgi:hypothetical protein
MDYQKSLKNINDSINFVLPINEDYAIIIVFEDSGPEFNFLKIENFVDFRNLLDLNKKDYACIRFFNDSLLRYSYLNSELRYNHNYDKNQTDNDLRTGYKGDVKTQLLQLVRMLNQK